MVGFRADDARRMSSPEYQAEQRRKLQRDASERRRASLKRDYEQMISWIKETAALGHRQRWWSYADRSNEFFDHDPYGLKSLLEHDGFRVEIVVTKHENDDYGAARTIYQLTVSW